MIRKLAMWVLHRELEALRLDIRYLVQRNREADERWVELNKIMQNRAQQERGLQRVWRGKTELEVLAVKTTPGSIWDIYVK
jgi:hypothetical protein